MAYSSSETFAVVDYGTSGTLKPVNLPLTRGINSGTVLTVIASITGTGQWNVKDRDGNIILHVISHIDQNAVLFNTHVNSWGPAEKAEQMPIKAGKKFTLHIAYETHGYYIYINGEELHYFKQRIDNPATTFEIKGGQLYFVSYKYNTPLWIVQRQRPIYGLYTQEFETGKQTPHEMQVKGCNTLTWIEITGIADANANSFDISFVTPSDKIVFYFSPRFTEKWVIRNNATQDGSWGMEENAGGMPFEQNQKFVLAIEVEKNCYRTYVNGEEFITFNHRTPAESITSLKINKDVKIFKITYHK